jgi:peptidoglycan/LPS O-acetylase OafA/YrhL
LLIYFVLSLSLSAIAYFSHGGIVSMIGFFSYSSPFVIIASLYLLLAFTKFHFSNKVVNWIASSTFAVYLLHENFSIVTSYRSCIYALYSNDNQIYKWGVICTMIVVYILAILLDKVRLLFLSTIKYILNEITRC